MSGPRRFLAELQRRSVPRAVLLYAGAVWALAQGIAQLSPAVGLPDWATRWFLIAAIIGFPFWLAFAWVYEWTPQGFKRESEIAQDASITRSTGRKLDRAIIAVLALAVVLLVTDRFVSHGDAGKIAIPDKSIAVLPLANESGDKDQQFFSDGLSESLITALSQFDGLKVISRNSAFQFRGSRDTSAKIGQLLGVAHLLEGSVQRAGDTVRITATLVNAGDGSTLWSDHYDKPYKDLFALQDAITAAVADALKAKLMSAPGAVVQSDRPPSGNLAAYVAYQQGNAYFDLGTEASFHQAIDAFGEAIRLDPNYAAAYARLSYTWAMLGDQWVGTEPMAPAYAKARAAVDTALKLDHESALAHLARAFLLQAADFDWTGAESESRRALQLAPNDAAAQFALASVQGPTGKVQQGVDLVREALVADPRRAYWYYRLSQYLSGLGQWDAAKQSINTAIGIQPTSGAFHAQLAMVEIGRGDARAALTAAQQEPDEGWRETAMTMALQVGADRAAADAALKTFIAMDANWGAYQIAEVNALRRDPDNTFLWLDRAWSNRDTGIYYLLFDPFILRYRADPRFAAFCKKVGLPTTTDAKALP